MELNLQEEAWREGGGILHVDLGRGALKGAEAPFGRFWGWGVGALLIFQTISAFQCRCVRFPFFTSPSLLVCTTSPHPGTKTKTRQHLVLPVSSPGAGGELEGTKHSMWRAVCPDCSWPEADWYPEGQARGFWWLWASEGDGELCLSLEGQGTGGT